MNCASTSDNRRIDRLPNLTITQLEKVIARWNAEHPNNPLDCIYHSGEHLKVKRLGEQGAPWLKCSLCGYATQYIPAEVLHASQTSGEENSRSGDRESGW